MQKFAEHLLEFVIAFALTTCSFCFVQGSLAFADTAPARIANLIDTSAAVAASLVAVDDSNSNFMIPPPPSMGSTTKQFFAHCPQITKSLIRGLKDATSTGEVSELQKFFADYYQVKKEDVVTGFFGSSTANYVRKFQKEQGLDQVGNVGPMTRGLIAKACARAINQDRRDGMNKDTRPFGPMGSTSPEKPRPAVVPGMGGGMGGSDKGQGSSGVPTLYFGATPKSGEAPLSVQFGIKTIQNGGFTIQFGDGEAGSITVDSASCSTGCVYKLSHTYIVDGSYTAKITQTSTGNTASVWIKVDPPEGQ